MIARYALLSMALVALHGLSLTAAEDENLKALTKDLKSKDPKARLKAAEKIGELGANAAPAAKDLCNSLLDQNPKVSLAALLALEKVRPDIYKPLSKAVLDTDTDKRIEGIVELGRLGKEAEPAATFVASVLTQRATVDASKGAPIRDVAISAYKALADIASDNAEVAAQMKVIAGPSNKSLGHRNAALGYLVVWADEDDKRRKELVPLIRLGIELGSIRHIELAARYGAVAKDCLPALKQQKIAKTDAIRQAATKAVDEIESALKK